jgi:hypothetical protein
MCDETSSVSSAAPPSDNTPVMDRLRRQLAGFTQHWQAVAPLPLFLVDTATPIRVIEALFPKVSRTTLYRIAKRVNLDNP